MDPERLIGELIGGFLGGKKKRRRGGFGLSGVGRHAARRAGGSLLNAGTLLTVGGLIWGALETMQGSATAERAPGTGDRASDGSANVQHGTAPGTVPPPPPVPDSSPRGVMSGASGPAVVPPPLPIPGTSLTAVPPPPPLPTALLPLIQLAVSAARADGELSDEEIALIRDRADTLGAAALVDAELQARRPLDSIASAFVSPQQREVAYAVAYAVVRGQDGISPGERMYLTQLQRLLALPHDIVDRIERETLSGESG